MSAEGGAQSLNWIVGQHRGKKKQNYERYPPLSSQKIVKGSCETEDAGGVTFFLFVFLLFPFLLPPEVILLELHNRAQASNALFVGSSLCISHFMDHLPAWFKVMPNDPESPDYKSLVMPWSPYPKLCL